MGMILEKLLILMESWNKVQAGSSKPLQFIFYLRNPEFITESITFDDSGHLLHKFLREEKEETSLGCIGARKLDFIGN